MQLQKAEQPLALSPEHDASPTSHRTFAVRQGARLSIGVGGILGGAALLTANVFGLVAARVDGIPWIPWSANVALLLGSWMFLREYRRAAKEQARSEAELDG